MQANARRDHSGVQKDSRDRCDTGADDLKGAKLEFIRMMLRELRQMASQTNEPTLVYLVEMAALEASEASKVHKYQTELYLEN